jgi:hypothetical protein
MGGAMIRRRPDLFRGALVVPKHRSFGRILWMARMLQLADLAIVSFLNLPLIMPSIRACVESARFGAISLMV